MKILRSRLYARQRAEEDAAQAAPAQKSDRRG